jgi:hypothetical protein
VQKLILGDVIEVQLPRGRFAYGRVYRDASVGFYRTRTSEPGQPPIGSRDFTFFVGVEDRALKELRVVGSDPFLPNDDEWPPPARIRNVITGGYSIYHHGVIRASTAQEAAHLEPAAVWGLGDLRERLDRGD